MSGEPKRPWWRKQRWSAALVLWLVVAYPLGRGPAAYAVARGWLPASADRAAYAPLEAAMPRYGAPTRTLVFLGGPHMVMARPVNTRAEPFYRYVDWWAGLARP